MSIRHSKYIWKNYKKNGTHKMVLLALADFADDQTDECWPSIKTLADMVCSSERQVQRILADLKETGDIEINTVYGRSRTNTYKIITKGDTSDTFSASKGDIIVTFTEAEKVTSSAEKVTSSAEKVTSMSPDPLVDPLVDPLKSDSGDDSKRQQPPPAFSAKPLVPQKPVFGGGTSVRQIKPPIQTDSPHVEPRKFIDGYIPEGKGGTAVEVYYERFSIRNADEKLTAPLETDLVKACPDLDKLRAIIAAYSQKGYRGKNVSLILDWYKDGIPKHVNGNGNHAGQVKQEPAYKRMKQL